MKIRLTLLTLLAGFMTLNAQDNPPAPTAPPAAPAPGAPGAAPGGRGAGGPGGAGRGRFQPTDEEKKKYDKDGNGELSREEMRALFTDRQKEMEKKYDANGDGKLDDEEKKKMESENPRRGAGGPGGFAPQPPTAEEIKTHDKNGDGKLEGEEATALREARQKARLEKYDTDKDGKLSDEEMRKAFQDGAGPGRGRGTGGGRAPRPGGDAPKDGEKKTDAPKIPTPGAAESK